MKRTTIVAATLLTSLSFAGAATAGDGNGDNGRSVDAKRCAAEKKADKAAFKALYGKHAMRKCIKAGPERGEVREFRNAAKECKAEREADPEGFQETYGANENRRNALGKCVSGKMDEDEETPEAA